MNVPERHAFTLAYQWWLTCDGYFQGLHFQAGGEWIREIGGPYGVNRTLPKGVEGDFAKLILSSGQCRQTDLDRRAIGLASALEKARSTALKKIPVSAACKLSWFVWPHGWTMYDHYAARGVLGTGRGGGTEKMERFYTALALRGWTSALEKVRSAMPEQFPPLLAERTLDKYFFLLGRADEQDGDLEMARTERRMNVFLAALSPQLRETVEEANRKVAAALNATNLGCHGNQDKRDIRARVEALRKMQEGII